MDGTGRFLLGGALGAALGYLLSQKNLEKSQPTDQVPAPFPVAGGSPAPVSTTPVINPGIQTAMPAAPPVAPTQDWRVPPTPPAQTQPPAEPNPASAYAPRVVLPTPAPAYVPPTVAPTPAPAYVPPTVAPAPVPAPAAVTPPVVAPKTDVAPTEPIFDVETPVESVLEVPVETETVDSEVVLTREFLEEPIPGSGWRSSAPMVEDQTSETAVHELPRVEISSLGPELSRPATVAEPIPSVAMPAEKVLEVPVAELSVMEDVVELPVIEDIVALPEVEEPMAEAMGPGTAGTEALAQAATVAGRLPMEPPFAGDSSRVDDLKSRIEETRRRIRHELEQPFDVSSPARAPERDWTSAPAVSLAEPVVVPEATETEPLMKTAEPVVLAPEPVLVMEPAEMEPVVIVPTAPEPAMDDQAVAEPVAVDILPMESLEIEMLLEEPVATELSEPEPIIVLPMGPDSTASELPVVESEQTAIAEVEPVAAQPPVSEPMPKEAVRPAVEVAEPLETDHDTVEPVGAPDAVLPLELEVAVSDEDTEVALGLEEPVDYDSMKNRIESTRSRLKAKAFDAMMTGEAALLGRDVEGATSGLSKVTGVDSDIDETIETSLREEEE